MILELYYEIIGGLWSRFLHSIPENRRFIYFASKVFSEFQIWGVSNFRHSKCFIEIVPRMRRILYLRLGHVNSHPKTSNCSPRSHLAENGSPRIPGLHWSRLHANAATSFAAYLIANSFAFHPAGDGTLHQTIAPPIEEQESSFTIEH